jgi:hypothetical protein
VVEVGGTDVMALIPVLIGETTVIGLLSDDLCLRQRVSLPILYVQFAELEDLYPFLCAEGRFALIVDCDWRPHVLKNYVVRARHK